MCFYSSLKKIGVVLLFASFFSASAKAAPSKTFDRAGFHITVEPILAYEFSQVNTPTLHTRGMLMYGGRVTAGHKLISAEGEYTLGTTNETFPGNNQNIKTSKQNARLGIRSAIGATTWLDFILRLGGQASQVKVETTTITTGNTLTDNAAWEIHPYAGTGLQMNVLHAFTMALEATYLFRSVQDWSQNDVQTSVSFKFTLPTK